MRIAIGLCGSYSSHWQLGMKMFQSTDVDLFMASFQPHADIQKYAKASALIPMENVHNTIRGVSETCKPDLLRRIAFDFLTDFICKTVQVPHLFHESVQYDVIILITFRTIVLHVPRAGVHDFTAFTEYTPTSPYVHLISYSAIRSSYEPLYLERMDVGQRRSIFQTLYGNQVVDAELFDTANLLSEKKQYDAIWCIPSVVHCSQREFDYSTFGSRSVFTPSERFDQTLAQVRALSRIPGSHVFWLEGSHLTLNQMEAITRFSNVTLLLFHKHPHGNLLANEHRNKSLFELWLLKWMIQQMPRVYRRMYKFGGRYSPVTDSSLHSVMNADKLGDAYDISVKEIESGYTEEHAMECIVYGFSANIAQVMGDVFTQSIETIESATGSCATEQILWKYIKQSIPDDRIERCACCGVVGKDAIYGFDKVV